MLCHSSIEEVLKLNFNLSQHHGWDISTIEQLTPFERDVYVTMLVEHLKALEEHKRMAAYNNG